MGFNAVLGSAMAARNFVARKQIDKRVKLLLPLNGNLTELSGGAEASTISSSYEWVSAPYSGQAWKRTNESNQLQISCQGSYFNEDWSMEFFWKRFDSVADIATIGGRSLSTADGNFFISNGSTIVHVVNMASTGIWHHYRESYINGTGSCYYDGSKVYTYSGNILQNVLGLTLGLNVVHSRGLLAICDLRVTTVGTDAATIPIPTAPYTGFEPLGGG